MAKSVSWSHTVYTEISFLTERVSPALRMKAASERISPTWRIAHARVSPA